MNQPSTCAPWNIFGNGPFTHVYKPLDPNAWPKSKNGKKICHLDMFKLSILQENKWEVGWALEATLLTPSNIPPPRYGHIYCLLLGLPKNRKQYETMISEYLACNCVDFSSMMSGSLGKQGSWVPCKHFYYFLQYAIYSRIRKPLIHYPSWSWNEVHRLLDCAKVLEVN